MTVKSMTNDRPRLIEVAFPLKQASLDSVHEKNVRHGHISTLHIWPARRPLAASRAALIATLLPDPGSDAERKRLLERLGGILKRETVYKTVGGRKVPVTKELTDGGILHSGRESGPDLDYFREAIKKAYDGRVIEREIAQTRARLDGQERITIVVFGSEGDSVLLGAYTLEGFSLAPDPVNHRLVRVRGLAMARTGVA